MKPQATSDSLKWRHNEHVGVSNHQPHNCLRNRLFKRRSNNTSKSRVTCLCKGNSPLSGEFPAQRTSNAENVSIWWRPHLTIIITSFGGILLQKVFKTAGTTSDQVLWHSYLPLKIFEDIWYCCVSLDYNDMLHWSKLMSRWSTIWCFLLRNRGSSHCRGNKAMEIFMSRCMFFIIIFALR